MPVGENPIGTFLVKICDVCGSCFLSHRFPQISTDSFFCILLPLLSSHTDLTILTDFLPFYPFTLLLFYLKKDQRWNRWEYGGYSRWEYDETIEKGLYATTNGVAYRPFLLYQGYWRMAPHGLKAQKLLALYLCFTLRPAIFNSASTGNRWFRACGANKAKTARRPGGFQIRKA